MYGYTGQILFIDLSRGITESLPLAADEARAWLGGCGLGAHLLYRLTPPHTPALAPQSVLAFVSGALTCSSALLAGRYCVICQSPLTNSPHQASTGGSFGSKLRKAGYDAVLVSGIAAKPVYVYIDETKVEIRDAAGLWGKTINQATNALAAEMGRDACYCLIGPAGECRHRSACIINESGSSAGQGCGAVMGAKNLKALVLRGDKKLPLADQGAIKALNQRIMAERQSGGDFQPPRYACFSCPISCGSYSRAKAGTAKSRPKPSTARSFAVLLAGNDNDDIVRRCNEFCDEYGLDTLAVAGSIAWLLQCTEAGLFTAAELGNIDLSAAKDAILELTWLTVTGQGIGAILSEGADYAAGHWRRGQQFLSPQPAPQSLTPGELTAWLAAAKNKTALSLEDGKGKIIQAALRDACGFCKFDAFHLAVDTWLAYLNAATGWGMDMREFILAGIRLAQIGSAFDLRQNGEQSAATAMLAGLIAKP